MSLEPGSYVGRYRVTRLIAQGGMAEVYRADQELTGGIFRPAALKVIRPEYSESPDFREMFLDEARLACTLSHPNIVHIYEVGEADGRLYMAMELVPGESLAHVARLLRDRGERFSDEALIAIGVFTCSALDAVHRLRLPGEGHVNLVHRDVSPHNLLLSASGSMKLIDFGIAKASSNRNLTSAGVTKGKAGYFSPEQAMGRALDGRSDLFSLGVTLYKLAWGGTPFDQHKSHHDRNTALVHGRWSPLREVCPGLPEGFYEIVDRSLRVDPAERFADAIEMRYALEQLALECGYSIGSSTLAGYLDPHEDDPMSLGARPPPSARHVRPAGVVQQAAGAVTVQGTAIPAAQTLASETGRAPTRLGDTAVASARPEATATGVAPPSSISAPQAPRRTERLAAKTLSEPSIQIQQTRKTLLMVSGAAVGLLATIAGLIIGERMASEDAALPQPTAATAPGAGPAKPAAGSRGEAPTAGAEKGPAPVGEKAPVAVAGADSPSPSPSLAELRLERVPLKRDPPPLSRPSLMPRPTQSPTPSPAPAASPRPVGSTVPAAAAPPSRATGGLPGKLRVGPAEGVIFVDGKKVATAPKDVVLPAGTYEVTVKSQDGKRQVKKTVTVPSDGTERFIVDFDE